MAIVSTTTTTDEEFAAHVAASTARNIKAMLGLRGGLSQSDAARLIGMNRATFSTRMTGSHEWKLWELKKLASMLGCTIELLTAETEQDFRELLSSTKWDAGGPFLAAVPTPSGAKPELHLRLNSPSLTAVAK